MSIEEVASDIADSMLMDMRSILRAYLGRRADDTMLEELVDAGMFHVKHLLVLHACDEQREMIDHE
jgi:hypothetical protein